MSDERRENESLSLSPIGDDGRIAVFAHTLLSNVTAVRGALDLAMSSESPNRETLLAMAVRRLDAMTEALRNLTFGIQDASSLLSSHRDHPSVVDLREGTLVEVHSSFNNTWTPGFEIAAVVDGGYRVRRTSDGSVLPGRTGASDLRVAPDRPGS